MKIPEIPGIPDIKDIEPFEFEDQTPEEVMREAADSLAKLKKDVPQVHIVNVSPERELACKQKFVPQCKLCKHPLRDEAESIYAKYNFVPARVRSWLKSKGENFTWECIATHMKNHCIWDKPSINVIERIAARQDEISTVKQDRIQWNLDALTVASLDMLAQVDSLTGEESVKVYNSVCNGMKVQAQLMKLQHDTQGAQSQAKSIIEANNKRLINFLERLMEILDNEQKIRVVEFMREFQTEEAKGL